MTEEKGKGREKGRKKEKSGSIELIASTTTCVYVLQCTYLIRLEAVCLSDTNAARHPRRFVLFLFLFFFRSLFLSCVYHSTCSPNAK